MRRIENQVLTYRCPKLNSVGEAILEIEYNNNGGANPVGVICKEYDSNTGICNCKDNKEEVKCIYSNGFQRLK